MVDGLRPPETTLSGEDGVQTLAESIGQLLRDIALRMKSSGSVSECVFAMSQCEETEEILHPPETTLSGERDAQTLAESIEQLLRDIALRMESSGSETGNRKASDSGVSLKRVRSKTEPIDFNDGQRRRRKSF